MVVVIKTINSNRLKFPTKTLRMLAQSLVLSHVHYSVDLFVSVNVELWQLSEKQIN